MIIIIQEKSKGKRIKVEEIDSNETTKEQNGSRGIENNEQLYNHTCDNVKEEEVINDEKQNSSQRIDDKTGHLDLENKVITEKDDIEKPVQEEKLNEHVAACEKIVPAKDLSQDVVEMIGKANGLYKTGQYPEASQWYTSAIHILMDGMAH